MRPVIHARFVAREERRREPLREGEVLDLIAAHDRRASNLACALRFRLARIGLEILLGEIVRVRLPSIHEPQSARNLADLVEFCRVQNILDEKEHRSLSLGPENAAYRDVATIPSTGENRAEAKSNEKNASCRRCRALGLVRDRSDGQL